MLPIIKKESQGLLKLVKSSLFLFIIFLGANTNVNAQLSTTHYLIPMDGYYANGGIPEEEIYLSTTNTTLFIIAVTDRGCNLVTDSLSTYQMDLQFQLIQIYNMQVQ